MGSWHWEQSTNPLSFLSWDRVVLVIIDQNWDPHLVNLINIKKSFPDVARVLIGAEKTNNFLDYLISAVNQGEVITWIENVSSFENFKQTVSQIALDSEAEQNRARLIRASNQQNRELEKLTASLEQIVTERTFHIQESKELEEEKVSDLRSLIRFIQRLSLCISFEELLDLLRKDFKSFHQVQEPILIYEVDAKGPHIVSWQRSRLQTRPWPHTMDFIQNIHLQDPEMSRKLANFLSRPFAKSLVIPLQIPVRDSLIDPTFHLVLENSLSDDELNEVLDFCLERLQPLATAVERVYLENELMHFSFRWERTFDALKDPIAIIDRSHQVLRANKKFSDHILTKPCYESFAHRKSECDSCPVPNVFLGKGSGHSEVRVLGKIYEVHSYPISLVEGGIVSNVVNQYIDRTQEKETYMRLLQSEKMGALGLLAGNIAHELNNPLTGLRSLAQVLMAEVPEKSQIAQDLHEIEKATKRSQKIIRNLLEFVQNRSSQLEKVNLDDLIEKTLTFLKTALRNHRLKKDLNTADAFINAEPQLLQQVIFNLIHNACQAMESAGELIVKSYVENDSVFLVISDTGPGVPVELQSKIFEPFFTTKKEGSGTGLGLSLSREIVEQISGTLSVQLSSLSEGKSGSSFVVKIPQLKESSQR